MRVQLDKTRVEIGDLGHIPSFSEVWAYPDFTLRGTEVQGRVLAAAHADIAQVLNLGQCQALCLLFQCESADGNLLPPDSAHHS